MSAGQDPARRAFYDRAVVEVARDLVGCVLRHNGAAGRIVETEAYHETEPACHAYTGLSRRTNVLFGDPGLAYVYRSYGIHALLNAVCEPPGTGAAVLIRALEPLDGLAGMRARRGSDAVESLCSGPGKLTQALGIGLGLNGSRLGGEIAIEARAGEPDVVVAGPRIGITRAVDLQWRFCDVSSRSVSRPWPAEVPRRRPLARR